MILNLLLNFNICSESTKIYYNKLFRKALFYKLRQDKRSHFNLMGVNFFQKGIFKKLFRDFANRWRIFRKTNDLLHSILQSKWWDLEMSVSNET